MKSKNSVYLEKKAENLQQALQFFLNSGHNRSRDERLLTFLDQIDYWDWEVDELCFSFNNFSERAKAFDTGRPGVRAAEHGIMVKASKAENLGRGRRYDTFLERTPGMWATGRVPVVAPTEALQAVLATWHELLDIAEKTVMAPVSAVETARKAGVTTFNDDLKRYRKAG